MIFEILKMLLITIVQNASFTLVSRARNSKNLLYNTLASLFSNSIWILVIREVIQNYDKTYLVITYVLGATIGSVMMQHIAIKYLEKKTK